MEHRTYSSLRAFLAHYLALREAGSISIEERKLLASMEKILDTLRPEELLALDSDSTNPPVVRHRERALMRLERELRTRGMLAG